MNRAPLLDELLRRALASAARPIVIIDGRSGSGKTDLSNALANAWPAPVELVHLDDIYPGWNGLDAASRHVHAELLSKPAPRYRRHDWVSDEPAEWISIDPNRPVIIEGIGALSRENADRATLRVWIELDTAERKRRALQRDGAAYEPHWETWAAQEERFIAREHPQSLADLIIDENRLDENRLDENPLDENFIDENPLNEN